MMDNILDPEMLRKQYCFIAEDKNREIYFCNCGHITEHQKQHGDELVSHNAIDNDTELSELYKQIALASKEEIRCSGCNKNFSTIDSQKTLVLDNTFFASGYFVENTENELTLYQGKTSPVAKKNNRIITFFEKKKYLKFNKKTKKTTFKGFDDVHEIEFDLNEVVKYSNYIFSCDTDILYNVYQIQLYINELAKYVIDIKNTNIVDELLSETRNKSNDAGLNTVKKIISIFLGIIKYSNLSTIALTKGCKFLYDLMTECDIPKSNILKESGTTAPIDIFNYLVKNYIKKINEEVNEDNKEVHEFMFKSSQIIKSYDKDDDVSVEKLDKEREMKVSYSTNKDYKTKVAHNYEKGSFKVLEISNDANASKFIYKNIRNFSDYKRLLKFFKFYDRQQIISLMQKYDIEILIKIIDLVYFRDRVELKEFERILTIIKDYTIEETLKYKPTLNKNFKIDYTYVDKFDFTYYDDCVMMMEVLEFDPKREFNKIKTYHELIEYHNNLTKLFSVVSDKDKGVKFRDFVDRFKFIEDRDNYNGPLDVKLITSPSMLIAEGVQMKHSASSYSKKVINGTYIIGQAFDRTEGLPKEELVRFTIGFSFDRLNGLEFHQVKGHSNKQGSDRFKKLLMEFLTSKDISFRPIKDLKLNSA